MEDDQFPIAGDGLSFDEARRMGVPEQTIQDALMEADQYIFGTSFGKYDQETGVWIRVDPRHIRVSPRREHGS